MVPTTAFLWPAYHSFQFPEGTLSHADCIPIEPEIYERLLSHASQENDFVYLGSVGKGDNRGQLTGFSALASEKLSRSFDSNKPCGPDSIANLIEESLEPFSLPVSDNAGCLKGGWIGFISYEFGHEVETRLHTHRRKMPAPLINAGLYLWMASYDRPTGSHCLWVHPGAPHWLRERLDAWQTTPTAPIAMSWKTLSPFQARQDKSQFEASVEKVRDYIAAGDCYQANLSQEFTAPYTGDPWQAFRALAENNPTPHSGFIRSDGAAVLSVSPERFLRIENNTVTTSPIKGTRPRGHNPSEDEALARELQNSEKDLAENLMIVDLLRNDLSKSAVDGSVQVDGLFALESYRNVHHLVSHIRCQLAPGVSPMKALFDAFPGGSITGAPKIRAMEIIRELEPHDRGPYCGSVFYRSMDGLLESNIAIRTLYADDNGVVHCCGGGGIVADSDPESEYQETLTKVKSLMEFLETLGGGS
ncbi:aminodeoxychorismate synthase component I [Marinobacter sp. CHS3-4]|uniref:aminodeoxychorismate synthase component I n=1 Tax=Marinobacter sp. CHS3-4 TaxID=3045174 RepID=UPI0024B4F88A|nr:aminodeoxychorismate synthase component I [Marinobacter sp. CHS3-4]MDI9245522.1 aminodeoxychorismate synthase component I [Marinobacter sp. CHS3-4]